MLHGVRIKDGTVTYVNRYVRTKRFATEEEAGEPVYTPMGDFAGFSAILRMLLTNAKRKLGVIQGSEGTANTALIFHGKTLLALNEGDLPYALRVLMDGELETLGLQSYGGKLKHNVTAHPKVDAETGELFFFGYNMAMKPPYIKYGVASKDAQLQFSGVPITIPKPIMMHDFAITKRFAIFLDMPLVFDGKVMVAEGKLPFVFDKSLPSRFGLLPRYARDESEIKWFVLKEACYIFHTANAWEEGDDIVKLVACAFPSMDLNNPANKPASVIEYSLQLSTGTVTQRRLAKTHMEFPRVKDTLIGRKSRFVYAGILGTRDMSCPRIEGIVKVDVDLPGEDASEVGKIIYGEQRYGGEPVFVPRVGGTSEDDGFLLVFVHDETTGTFTCGLVHGGDPGVAPQQVGVRRV
eukprot:jgi/Mesvir1/1011/Mv17545-RA.1